jgi:hypothetical protein
VQARSESISPANGADGPVTKPPLPQKVVPGEFVKESRNAPAADAVVDVVVEVVVLVVVEVVVLVVAVVVLVVAAVVLVVVEVVVLVVAAVVLVVVEVVVLVVAAVVLVVAVVVLVVAAVVLVVVEVVVLVVAAVVLVVVEVVVLVVAAHGSGTQVPGPLLMPPAAVHASAVRSSQVNAPPGEPGTQHWMFGAVVVVVLLVVVLVVEELVVAAVLLVVVEVVVLVVAALVLVVELVVVVEPTGQRGRPASPVQVQRRSLHCLVMFFAQLLPLELGPHASLTSSAQATFLSHLPLSSAIAEEETKTPTANATVANKTAALLVVPVIAELPPWPLPVSPYPSPHDPPTPLNRVVNDVLSTKCGSLEGLQRRRH